MKTAVALALVAAAMPISNLRGQIIPENDSFAARIALSGTSVATTGKNINATKEINEPDPNFTGGKSVWWTWTAPSSGYLTITTAGSSFDTTLSVFTGSSLPNLTLVAFNDADLGTSTVEFNVSAGTVYQIAVDGSDSDYYETNNAAGNISLQLTLGLLQPPPANDNFANRTTLVGTHLNNVPGSNLGASAEPGEPFHADAIGLKSVWWSWTAPSSGGVTLDTEGSFIDTVLAVYTGSSVSNLTLVTANDEDLFGAFGESRVTFNAVDGVTYQIAVDGYEGDAGDIRLQLDLGNAFPVPANDNFANRITLTGNNITTNWSNVGATYEPNEPMHLVTLGGKTVWWSWTAPANGGVTLNVSNNLLDTLVAVYKGTTLANLEFVAGNDEDFILTELLEGDSTAYFNVTSGTTYQIAVDGVDGNEGNFRLRLVLGIADTVPVNDNFAARTSIPGTNTTVTRTNFGATIQIGEPLHRGYYGGCSVWWTWTSPGPGYVTIDTSNSVPDTLLAVYTGTTLAGLTEIASDNNSGGRLWSSRVSFPTKSNVTYQIAVDGYDGDADRINLRVRFGQASYSLTINTNPADAGTITVEPPPDQGGKYAPGSVVTLTANPVGGSLFTGWLGDANATNNPLVLTMSSNKTVTADFFVVPTTKVWTGGHPQNGNWSVNSNWEGGLVPVPGDELIFPPGAARLASNTNNLATNMTFKSIVFGGADYILRGNPFAITNGIICTNTTGTNTLALNAQLNATQTFRCSNPAARLVIAGGVNLGSHTLVVDAGGDASFSGVISGTGGMTKTNTGTLSLIGSAANTYSGAIVVNQGTLELGKSGVAIPGALVIGDGFGGDSADVVRFTGNAQLASSSPVTINGSGRLDLDGFTGTAGSLTMTSGTVATGAGSLGLNGGVTVNAASAPASITGNLSLQGGTRTFNVADGAAAVDLMISAVIANGSGTGGITKSGNGILQLTAANSFSGTTTINAGTLAILSASGLGTTAQGTTVNGNGSLSLSGAQVTGETLTLAGGMLRAEAGSNSWTANIAVTSNSTISSATNSVLNLTGVVSGNGGLTKKGDGTVIFSGALANTYSGDTTVEQGLLLLSKTPGNSVPGALVIGDGMGSGSDTVRLSMDHQIAASSVVTLNGSGLLDLNNRSNSVSTLAGDGKVELNGTNAGLTLGGNNASGTFSGNISGPGKLIKAGTGTLLLSGTNSFTGQTLVIGGLLTVNGRQPGSLVNVSLAGTLGGTGEVGQVSLSGTLSPGSSPGRLSCSNLTFSAGATNRVELNGPDAGTGYDQLGVSGTVNLAGRLSATVGFAPAINQTFTIIENDGADPVLGTFNGLPEGAAFVMGGFPFQISYAAGTGSNDVVLTRVIPLPSTISSLVILTNGVAQLGGTGTGGLSYILEAAPMLDPPISWVILGTNIADGSGAYQFTDSEAPLFPMRFYRVRSR